MTLLGISAGGTRSARWEGRFRTSSLGVGVGLGAACVAVVGIVAGRRGLPILLGAALAAPLLFALRRRPQRGVLALVALVPFDGLRLITPLPSFVSSWKELLVLATLGATFFAPAEARARGTRRQFPPWAPAVGGLLILGVVSAVAVGGEQAITGFRIDYFYLLLAIAIWRCPLATIEKDRLVTVLMVTGVITAFVGVAQQGVGESKLHALGYAYNSVIITSHGHLRSFSTFASNFEFAFFLMVVLLIGLPSALADPRRLRNRAFLVCLPVFAVALLLTYTRGAWLGLAVGGIYIGVRRHRVLLLAIPVVVLVFAFLPGSITAASFSSTSLGQRGTGWHQNFDEIVNHPLGVGIGATGAAAVKVTELEAGGSNVNTSVPGTGTYQPDNYYYKTVYELGVLGLWLWILLLSSSFLASSRLAQSRIGVESAFAEGVAACVLGAAFASLVATYFEIFPMDVLFWLLITVVTARPPMSSPSSGRSKDNDPLSAWSAGAVFGALR